MTTFKSKTSSQTMTVETHASTLGPVVHVAVRYDDAPVSSIYLDPADAPAIALAVLEAAGHASQVFDATAVQCAVGNLEQHMDDAAAAAEEAARGKRRDELAFELSGSSGTRYSGLRPGGIARTAIDRIIDTENELAKERAK